MTTSKQQVIYGSGSIKGKIANDLVSIAAFPDRGAKINFLSVYEAIGLGNIAADGVLGLSPKKTVTTDG